MSTRYRLGAKGAEVSKIQRLLNQFVSPKILDDGNFGGKTRDAVMKFQKQSGLVVDGVVGEQTLALLSGQKPEGNKFLTETDIKDTAKLLGVDVASVKAVTAVESRGKGFLDDGRPVILFERHKFYQALLKIRTRKEVDELKKAKPQIVNNLSGGYLGGKAEWVRFANAAFINESAAIASASWGLFQIMGFNYAQAGFDSVESFRRAMEASEGEQLKAFANFIKNHATLHKSLQEKRWPTFARLYNGAGYKNNSYDVKLERAYKEYAKGQS